MSDDRTAAAAIAIESYIAGLRSELALLGSAASTDLVYEVRDMLLDAARDDPERAFAEMQRLGAPSALAATLLQERGIGAAGGIPSAAWWRFGIAATVDILIGFAAPAAVLVFLVVPVWQKIMESLPGVELPRRAGEIGIVLALLALSVVLSWRAWEPWRVGGRSSTAGMALAGVAVVRLGGSRTVVRRSDLEAAGLDAPAPGGLVMSATIASVILAALLLWGAASSVSAGSLDPSGADIVARFTTPQQASYEIQITSATKQLYGAAEMGGQSWPVISNDGLDAAALKDSLVKRFAQTDTAVTNDVTIGTPTGIGTGAWTVQVAETPKGGAARTVLLTWGFRLEWTGGDSGPSADWILIDYKPVP
jgi:hypothetical protein